MHRFSPARVETKRRDDRVGASLFTSFKTPGHTRGETRAAAESRSRGISKVPTACRRVLCLNDIFFILTKQRMYEKRSGKGKGENKPKFNVGQNEKPGC